MAGLSPKLPLVVSETDGAYALTKTYKELISQNLKNLVLTAPGERIMNPDFGVGLRNYLFENLANPNEIQSKISAKISEQVGKYMPFVEINDILFATNFASFSEDISSEGLSIKIVYRIVPINAVSSLPIVVKL